MFTLVRNWKFALLWGGLLLLFCSESCESKRRRGAGVNDSNANDSIITRQDSSSVMDQAMYSLQNGAVLERVNFYIENSASIFGYVNGYSEYVDVVSDLAEKPVFVTEKIERKFHFVNGRAEDGLEINTLENGLKGKLNPKDFRCGDVKHSDLNAMFQLALENAGEGRVSILISDGIYDIGKTGMPLNALVTEGKDTRSRFLTRLKEADLGTIIVKFSSDFNGYYYYASKHRKGKKIHQQRPFYVWIFGESAILNKYFPDSYFEGMRGFEALHRLLKLGDRKVAYQVISKGRLGSFKLVRSNPKRLTKVKMDRRGRGFRFVFAVDFSTLPFSDAYFEDTENYSCSGGSFEVESVERVGANEKIYGIDFEPTHLIAVATTGDPYGHLTVGLTGEVPNWLMETSTDTEEPIDTAKTFGFSYLVDGILEAYQEANKGKQVVVFEFDLEH